METCATEQAEQFQYIATQLKRIGDLLEQLVENTAKPPEAPSLFDKRASIQLHRWRWGKAVIRALELNGIMTVQDLLSKTKQELLSLPGIGCARLKKIRGSLRQLYHADIGE